MRIQASAFLLIFLTFEFLLLPFTAHAATSSNSDYSIDVGQINTDNPDPTQVPHMPQPQSIPKNITTNNPTYTVISTNDPFSFGLSQTAVDFGVLSATNPVIRTSDLQFSPPLFGAQVLTYENHPLIANSKTALPDTTCDNGSCSHILSAPWENSLTYGFGFRCESATKGACDTQFTNPTYFKQFPDLSANKSNQPIVLNQQGKRSISAKVFYKVNISGTQALGGYSNTITYVAIPNF